MAPDPDLRVELVARTLAQYTGLPLKEHPVVEAAELVVKTIDANPLVFASSASALQEAGQ